MRAFCWQRLYLAGLSVAWVAAGGCTGERSPTADSLGPVSPEELGATIGSVATVARPEPVPVEGYGLVGGLAGTGSADCPPAVRAYLRRYILAQLPGKRVNADELIDSKNTAVVSLDGEIPAAPSEGQWFDVRVSLIPGSGAISLRDGWLYKAELVPAGTFGAAAKVLGTVEGGVFVNTIGTTAPDLKNGYILGGGRSLYEYRGSIRLRRSSFTMASQIRNRLNERFGVNTAQAVSPSRIALRIPPQYRLRKSRFVPVVEATYLVQTPDLIDARIRTFVHHLAVSEEKEGIEVALEAVGRASVDKLAALLNAAKEEVRLRAARCMLVLGDDRGLATLREIALDERSPWRREALEAVAVSGERRDAVSLAGRLLRAPDVRVVLAAYEHLRRLGDMAVRRVGVGRSFYLERVVPTQHKVIFVTRSGDPRVVLFGAPLTCRDDLFVESPDGSIVVDSRAGQDYVSVMRNHPSQPGVIGPVRTGFDVSDIVRVLGAETVPREGGHVSGLGASYTDVTALLQQLTAKGAVAAEFWPGPLPKIGRIVKKP